MAEKKRCKKCEIVKPIESFNKKRGCVGGIKPNCRDCETAHERARRKAKNLGKKYSDAYNKSNPGKRTEIKRKWDKKNMHKKRAIWRVWHAKQTGQLVPEPCIRCGSDNSHGHHEDYRKPLDVTWLCRRCHATRHREIRADIAAGNADFWRERGIAAPQFDTVDRADIGHEEKP